MPKSSLRVLVEARIFQCGVYDTMGRKRLVAIYACGDDVFFADDIVSLMDREQRKPAPDWLKKQLKKLPDGLVRYSWQNEQIGVVENGVEQQVPSGVRVSEKLADPSPVVKLPPGTGLDDEASIPQG